MKKILVPTDFSGPSENALEVAASIARKHNAEIIVLHMMGLSDAVVTKNESREVFEAMYYMRLAEKRFEDLLNKDYLKGLTVSDIVHNYTVFGEINKIAMDMNIDLIVMGSHEIGRASCRERV